MLKKVGRLVVCSKVDWYHALPTNKRPHYAWPTQEFSWVEIQCDKPNGMLGDTIDSSLNNMIDISCSMVWSMDRNAKSKPNQLRYTTHMTWKGVIQKPHQLRYTMTTWEGVIKKHHQLRYTMMTWKGVIKKPHQLRCLQCQEGNINVHALLHAQTIC